MRTENLLSRIPVHYWGYASLALWGGVFFILLRQDFFNLDEGAAKALLLLWSVADNVASSVVTLGMPDLRSLLFIPPGVLWTGSIVAPKVLSILCMCYVAWNFYSWCARSGSSERALLGTGLLLISPLTLQHIDSLSAGIYLLATFVSGAWLNETYRATPRPMGGRYFAQLLTCAISVSLHPAGLAYPAALLWSWYQEPLDQRQQRFFFIGVIFIVLFMLVIRSGWQDVQWLQNPIDHLATIVSGSTLNGEMNSSRWAIGSLILAALVATLVSQFKTILGDFTGRTLFFALIAGIAYCDATWAMIALCVILYYGLPLLLRLKLPFAKGFLYERGTAFLAVFILSTLFMRADKAHYEIVQMNILSDQDKLIQAVVDEAERARAADEISGDDMAIRRLRVSSQWPSRTMIACKCDTLPLPPAAKDPESQLNMMRSITHLLFDPRQPRNMILARNLASLGGSKVETIALHPGGALLHFRNAAIETSAMGDKI